MIDGDFYWIFGPVQRIRGLYTLKCYSFENLAFERSAILKAAYIFAPGQPLAQTDASFSDERLDRVVAALLPLFRAYATCHLLNAQFETVNYSVFRLLEDGQEFLLSRQAVRSRIREVYSELRKSYSRTQIVEAKRTIMSGLNKSNASDSRFISGKSYLMRILLRWFQSEANYRGNQNQLLSVILEHSSLSIDKGMARALRRIAQDAR